MTFSWCEIAKNRLTAAKWASRHGDAGSIGRRDKLQNLLPYSSYGESMLHYKEMLRESVSMGSFKQLIRIAHPQRPNVPRELEILVDTGATFTKLPQDLLSELGIEATSSKRTLLADGRVLTRPSGHVRITIQGSTDTVPVIFGSRGEPMFLGATTLEILGFIVDPIAQKLVPREFLEPSESS